MPSDEELSPEEKLLKVIQDDGQEPPTEEPDAAGESEAPREERRLKLAEKDRTDDTSGAAAAGESPKSGGDEAAPADGGAEESTIAQDDSAEAEPQAPAVVAAGIGAPDYAAVRHLTLSALNRVLMVVVFLLIAFAVFEIASALNAYEKEQKAVSARSNGTVGIEEASRPRVEGQGDLAQLLKHVDSAESDRNGNILQEHMKVKPPTLAGPGDIDYNKIARDNIRIEIISVDPAHPGKGVVYLRSQANANPEYYNIGDSFLILNKYKYTIKSLDRDEVCLSYQDPDKDTEPLCL